MAGEVDYLKCPFFFSWRPTDPLLENFRVDSQSINSHVLEGKGSARHPHPHLLLIRRAKGTMDEPQQGQSQSE